MCKMQSEKVVVSGFTVIQTRTTEKSKAGHYFYVKEHNVATATQTCKPRDRTLYILNVPPYVTEACLERVFGAYGKVTDVFIHKKPTAGSPPTDKSDFFKTHPPITGFKVAYVVFANPEGVTKAKNTPFKKPLILSTEEHPLVTGVRKWAAEYRDLHICNTRKLQTEIDEYMHEYELKEQQEVEQSKQEADQVDEDGWTKVTRFGKNRGIPRTEVISKKVLKREKNKNKEKELLHFYAFQMREGKTKHIEDLRQKFEEDKNKIALMKAQRKFKPY